MSRRRRALVLSFALLAPLGLAALVGIWLSTEADGNATPELLEKVKAGMTLEQVHGLFGGPPQDCAVNAAPGSTFSVSVQDLDRGVISADVPTQTAIGVFTWTTPDDGWHTWRGRHGGKIYLAAVRFDAQGGARHAMSYEVTAPGLLERLQRWLGI